MSEQSERKILKTNIFAWENIMAFLWFVLFVFSLSVHILQIVLLKLRFGSWKQGPYFVAHLFTSYCFYVHFFPQFFRIVVDIPSKHLNPLTVMSTVASPYKVNLSKKKVHILTVPYRENPNPGRGRG